MHAANGLELMGSFRHAALLFVHTLFAKLSSSDAIQHNTVSNVFKIPVKYSNVKIYLFCSNWTVSAEVLVR